MNLTGEYFNEAKKITINLKGDNTYTLTGLTGYNTEFGQWSIGDAIKNIFGYPESLVLKHSTRLEDIRSSGTSHIPLRIISNNSFQILHNDFCVEDFYNKSQPAIFTKLM